MKSNSFLTNIWCFKGNSLLGGAMAGGIDMVGIDSQGLSKLIRSNPVYGLVVKDKPVII